MKINIFQICSDGVETDGVASGFVGLFPPRGAQTGWGEYLAIRHFFLNNPIDDDAVYGFFSPGFFADSGLTAADVTGYIESKPDCDAYTFFPFIQNAACFLNVFEEGDFFHRGLISAAQEYLQSIGLEIDLVNFVTDFRNTTHSNYIVAKPAFWKIWFDLTEKIFEIAESGSTPLAEKFNTPVFGEGNLMMKQLLTERIASLVLALDRDLKVAAFDIFEMRCTNSAYLRYWNEMPVLDSLKLRYRSAGDRGAFDRFMELRNRILEACEQRFKNTASGEAQSDARITESGIGEFTSPDTGRSMKEQKYSEAEYLLANPDVAAAVSEGKFRSGREHYEKYGESEGRLPKRLFGRMSREDKVFDLLDKTGQGLEIGPCHNPIAPKKQGFNVHILDHASATELREKYRGHGVNLDNIEEVDFVWRGEPLQELIGETNCYDWIIASHVIEHVPDFISFLQHCEALLKPDGVLSLVIPDKRYCFDYFSSSSLTGNVLDAYAEKRARPSPGQIFDHFANASKRNGSIAWGPDGMGGADALVHTFSQAQEQWSLSGSTADYIDVHCWRFTPVSFLLLISDLLNIGLINLEIKAEFDTTGCEFYVSLGRKIAPPRALNRLATLHARKLEDV